MTLVTQPQTSNHGLNLKPRPLHQTSFMAITVPRTYKKEECWREFAPESRDSERVCVEARRQVRWRGHSTASATGRDAFAGDGSLRCRHVRYGTGPPTLG